MFAKNIHIGCSSFYIVKRKNVFYPENILSAKWFAFYCMHFNSFEINATFYKFSTLLILINWYKKSPDGFIHCVKAPKLIKYAKKLVYYKSKIDEFFSLCRQKLNDKLGCILFQSPPSFHYSAKKLALTVEATSSDFKTMNAFRYQGWWSQEASDWLAKNDITFCSVSHRTIPPNIIANSAIDYIRLLGISKMFYSKYSRTDLLKLHDVVTDKKLFAQVFIFVNNAASKAGVLNAKELKTLFKS